MTDVNCMSCLVNLARGLDAETSGTTHQGITHAEVYEMGSGVVRVACRYELVDVYQGRLKQWRPRWKQR